MNLSRRKLLKGGLAALALGAFDGLPVFAAPPGWKPPKKPGLVVGILSDTHLQSGWDGVTPHGGFPLTYVTNAMKYFRDCDIDAFMHLGDAAHRGKNVEIQYHREIFDKFFPGGKSPRDGRKVEKLIVCGNHELYGDVVGGGPGAWAANIWKDKAERDKHTLVGNLEKHWEQTWGEKYEPVWHKEVKGYHFFGIHWREYEKSEMQLAEFILAKADEYSLRGTKPFFILSHKRNHFQCSHALREFPNAIAFCGHWHMSNADWKTIFFDEFGGFFPTIQVGACRMDGGCCLDGRERLTKGDIVEEKDDPNAKKSAWSEAKHPSRQGLVMSVYDDLAVVIERREFGQGGSLGPKWVFPIGKFETKPYSRATLTKKIGAPEFAKGATLAVDVNVGVVTGHVNGKPRTEPGIKLSIPMADGNPKSRAYSYDVVVVGDGRKLFKSVYFSGANCGVGHEPDHGVTRLEIPKSELPEGKELKIAVRPLSSLGTKGKPLVAEYFTAIGKVKPVKS